MVSERGDSERPPVILGGGIAGMAISDALSRRGVRHLVVGTPPSGRPGPGESLDLPASVLIPELFPELAEHLFSKRRVVTYFGGRAVDCSLELAPATRRLVGLLGFRAPETLLHLDRVGFDAALHRRVVASPHCRWLESRVTGLRHDRASDRVAGIELDDGSLLEPGFVFDASGPARLVAGAAGLAEHRLGRPQRGVMIHRHRAPSSAPATERPAWTEQTSFRRLYREIDGVDAGSWCIPLGDRLSVGVTAVDGAVDGRSDDELLELARRGFRAVGIDWEAEYPIAGRQTGVRHAYSHHRRGHGPNWLLVGGALARVWWPSSSGVGFCLAAAVVAPDIPRAPKRLGRAYEAYMRSLLDSHRRFDFFMLGPTPPSEAELAARTPALIRANIVRLALLARLARRGPLARGLGRLILELVGKRQLGPVSCRIRPLPAGAPPVSEPTAV